MQLSPGARLGAYEIVSSVGAGGMGEVYRARDTRLDRDVAVKILPETFAVDPDRLARFDREAKTLAALNHPHIAQIFGLEDGVSGDGRHVRALVMELVEGEDLSQRLARAAVPIEDALQIALQIADALEKDPRRRLRDIGEARVTLTDLSNASDGRNLTAGSTRTSA